MSVIKSENWDEVTAPALPTGWNATAAGGYATIVTTTTGATPISSPNMIYSAAGDPVRTVTWATLDGNSGDVAVQGTGLFDGGTGECEFAVFARGSGSNINYGSSSFYEFKCSGTHGDFEINKYVSGTPTNLFSVSTSYASNTWYQILGELYGGSTTAIRAVVTRLSDGYTLNMSNGFWTSGAGSVGFNDSSSPITGEGYAGWYSYPGPGTAVYGDDWSLSTYALTSLAAVEHGDLFAGTSKDYYGALRATESHDAFAGSASFVSRSGFAATERHDIGSIYAKVSPFLQATEHHDSFAAPASAGTGPAALLAVTEAHDSFAAVGGFTYDSRATFTAPEHHDNFAAVGTESSLATMAPTEHGDAFAAAVAFGAHAAAAPAEAGDTFRGGLERLAYHVYANTGAGDPINYSSAIDTTLGLSCTTSPLSFPGTWSFGVRAFFVVSGLEEQNLDCHVTIVLDASGNDITNKPLPPMGLRGFAIAAGAVRLEWTYGQASGPTAPQGFHVYIGSGGMPSYATPVATVEFSSGIAGQFAANLAGLSGGTTYSIGVRAYNATAEETNTSTINVTADSTGPSCVVSLTGIATS